MTTTPIDIDRRRRSTSIDDDRHRSTTIDNDSIDDDDLVWRLVLLSFGLLVYLPASLCVSAAFADSL
jgi:hypothetical protein